jgi:hypothetical protein
MSNSPELGLNRKLFSGALPDDRSPLWSQLLNGFWDLDLGDDNTGICDSIAYRGYFVTELDAWRCCSDNVPLRTYQDLVNLVKHLKDNASACRSSPEVLAFFTSTRVSTVPVIQTPVTQSEAPTPLQCESAIFLAVRLWLMVNVGHPNLQKIFPGKTQITWSQDDSIKELLTAQFSPVLQLPRLLGDFQYPRDLNVYDLERITGLVVVWTDHLADHLRLDLDLGTLSLYHHISILNCHKLADKQLYVHFL